MLSNLLEQFGTSLGVGRDAVMFRLEVAEQGASLDPMTQFLPEGSNNAGSNSCS